MNGIRNDGAASPIAPEHEVAPANISNEHIATASNIASTQPAVTSTPEQNIASQKEFGQRATQSITAMSSRSSLNAMLNAKLAAAKPSTPATNGYVEKYPAGQGLQFSETKAASSIAYYGKQGEVYQFPNGEKWQVADVKDDPNSGLHAVVLKSTDPNDQRVVLAFAGTDPTSLKDDLTDLGQAVGGIPKQYSEAADIAGQLKQQYGSNLILTGHSLGGGLASYASMRNGGIPATAVDAAPLSPTAEIAGLVGNPKLNQNITQYAAVGEIVSKTPGFNPGQHITVDQKYNTPGWHQLIPGLGAGEDLVNGVRNHLLQNTAPEVPLPTKVS